MKELQSIEVETGSVISKDFKITRLEEVNDVMQKSFDSFQLYKGISPEKRRDFIHAIADEIEQLGDKLFDAATRETGLPLARIKGETGRTCHQLRSYSDAAVQREWLEASIDFGDPERKPQPKPDLRKMKIPVGPVIVFGASNFPLAYSTAGGDTASALAAGCSVVVKAHPAHPLTAKLIGEAVQKALRRCEMPEFVFQQVFDTSFEVGQALVKHPRSASVAFTGSKNGGRALFDLASRRENPIPVFAEMSSINPVVILEGALSEKGEFWAEQFAQSVFLGAGQFCTNPGIIIGLKSDNFKKFIQYMGISLNSKPSQIMLNEGICSNYYSGLDHMKEDAEVKFHSGSYSRDRILGQPALASVSADHFLENTDLLDEVFGPFSLIVECESIDELKRVLKHIPGQLTSSLIGEAADLQANPELMDEMSSYCGRLILNGVPTGVEVCASQNHGGPYPSTTDSRFTAVGEDALKRFGRTICFQNFPEHLLPDELKESNPLKIKRREN